MLYVVAYQLYDVEYGCMLLPIKNWESGGNEEGSNSFDLIDSVAPVSTSSVVHPECSVVGVSRLGGVGWVPLIWAHISVS